MSSHPSPSKSRKAAPEPSVSGSHFFPVRPLLCVNVIPAARVTSVNVMAPCPADTVPADRTNAVIIARVRMGCFTWFNPSHRIRLPVAGARSGRTGSGMLSCSWIICRSLFSSGSARRRSPVIACADSSALKRRKSFSSRAAASASPRPRSASIAV